MKEPGCCSEFGHSIAEEFQLQNFLLTHHPIDDFYKSQWQKGSRSFWWLLWRWCAAGFFIAVVVASACESFGGGTFFIYLTDWGIILCMVATTYGAVLATIWYFSYAKRVETAEPSTSVKVFWAIHWATLVLATVITVMYWSFLFPDDPSMGSNPYNILQHACNSVVMIIDHMVVAFPSRILHFIYPLGIGVVYMIFTLIYYFAGGTDAMGNHFIYPILDWQNDPGMAVLMAVAAMIMCFVFSCLLFGLFKLRKFFYKECFNIPSPHVIPI